MVANTPAFIELEVSWSGSERVLLKDQDCLAEKSRQWAAEWALPLLCVMRCNEQSWPQCYCELKRPWASLDPSNPSLRPTLKKAGSQGKHTDTHDAHVFLLYRRMVSGTVSGAALMPYPTAILSHREVRDGSWLNRKWESPKNQIKTSLPKM